MRLDVYSVLQCWFIFWFSSELYFGSCFKRNYKIGDKSSLNNITEHNKCKILTQLSKYNHIEIKTDSLI